MKIHRFITEYRVQNGEVVIADAKIIHQWKNVLKFKIGENIALSDTEGNEALCELLTLSKTEAVLKVLKEYKNDKEVEKNTTLYIAILKRENFEFVAQKATELGITSIVPVITERTVKQNLNFERLHKIVKEAAELSGRSSIPEIKEIMNFKDAISDSSMSETRILFDSTGSPIGTKKELGGNKSIALFIGPEGGYTEKEMSLAKENNLQIISISPLTLRGETAAIVAVYLGINL
jgi:16S rRNA (uracil1498-N3)-methyltransferase